MKNFVIQGQPLKYPKVKKKVFNWSEVHPSKIFTEGEGDGDGIKSRLPLKIFSTLHLKVRISFYLKLQDVLPQKLVKWILNEMNIYLLFDFCNIF